ncbi:hypothetical protein [Pseudochrobactrum sp. MP213Fo]|uniref:hypothetical protein n=1 Tax=Pseudochrobactrum sp. MP213Fo TaxID=3022250 RepID=UPI003B9ED016
MSQSETHPQSLHDRIMNQAKSQPIAEVEAVTIGKQNKHKRRKSTMLAAILLLVGAIIGSSALWAIDNLPLSLFASAMPKPNLPDSVFLRQTEEAKLSACGTVFPLLGSLLTEGTDYKAQTRFHNKKPDQNSVQSNVGMTFSTEAYSGTAAGFVFAVPNGSACEGTMVRIVPFEKTCAEVEATLPEGTNLSEPLHGVAVYQFANNGGELMLLPSSGACIAISTVRVSDASTR